MTIHPARLIPYQELRENLRDASSKGHVACKVSGPLELWNYTDKCTYDKGWSKYTLIARGLIFDTEAERIVAMPFPKFFNYGENGYLTPEEEFEVTEKLDGSLGILYFYAGEWRVATRGSLDSSQARWAKDWLYTKAKPSALIPGTTYLAEIIYPENKIVISYPESGLVMLSAFAENGYELARGQLEEESKAAGFKAVSVHSYSKIEELLVVAKQLSADREGFVVRFKSGPRIKVKGDEYCRIHRLISRCTPLAVYDAMVAGDDLSAVRKQLPEEFGKDFDQIVELLNKAVEAVTARLCRALESTASMMDKELGILLQSGKHEFGDIAPFIFIVRKKGQDWLKTLQGRTKLYSLFRPGCNVLEGYQPCSVVSRFLQDASSGA